MMMMMMLMMNCFCDMVDQKRRLALFPARTIIRDPHHREFPTRREQVLNQRRIWPKRRMRLLIFLGCKGMENPNFWGRDWHPSGGLGIFLFLTSVFIFCNLSHLVIWVVEAIFWTILTMKSHLVYYEVTHSIIFRRVPPHFSLQHTTST